MLVYDIRSRSGGDCCECAIENKACEKGIRENEELLTTQKKVFDTFGLKFFDSKKTDDKLSTLPFVIPSYSQKTVQNRATMHASSSFGNPNGRPDGGRPNSLLLCGNNFQENATKFVWGVARFLCSVTHHVCLTVVESYQCFCGTILCALPVPMRSIAPRKSHGLILPESKFQEYSNPLHSQHPQPHVVVVGAGPSGLLGAIHLQAAFPALHIVLLEREYPRTHEVVIDPHNILEPLLRTRMQTLGVAQGASRRVPIDTLRHCLLERASELNVGVQLAHVMDSTWICRHFPMTHCVLIAEGAHSKLRKELFADDSSRCFLATGDNTVLDEYSFQNVIQIQYMVPVRVTKLDVINLHHAERLSTYVFEESVSYLVAKGGSKVTARFFVPDSVYYALPIGNQLHPLVLSDMPENLQRSISLWLNIRSDPIMQNVRATKFELKAFTGRSYSQYKHNRTWLLLGDAAFAVPYFRALNAGAYCASRMPHWLRSYFLRLQNDCTTRLTIRERTMWRLRLFFKFAQELISASTKDAIVETLKTLVLLSGSMPDSVQLTPLPPWTQTLHPIFQPLATTTDEDAQPTDNNILNFTFHPAVQFVRTAQRTATRMRIIIAVWLIVLAACAGCLCNHFGDSVTTLF